MQIVQNSKWIRFVNEGIDKFNLHKPSYYSFDWDDNIVFMPTKIIMIDIDNTEVGISTEEYAHHRDKIGKEPVKIGSHTIKNFAPNAFRNFRVEGDKQFLKDIMYANPAPAWDDFVECLNSASIFSIITARGHHPNTLKKAVYKYIISNHNGIDQGMIRNNLKNYNEIFQRYDRDASIKGYLNLCKFYPVSFNADNASTPEKAKVLALRNFINYCEDLNPGEDISMGFSDDDRKNMDLIEKHFSNERDIPKMVFKYTGK